MKNIWLLNHYAVPPGFGGGTRHYDFACELVKRGYDVTIFASSFNHFTKKELLEEGIPFKEQVINGVKFIWVKTSPKYEGNDIRRILNMVSYLFQITKNYKKFSRPDVVIGSSVHLFACLAAYYVSKKTGAKFLCEIRDLWPQTLIDMGTIKYNHPLAVFFRLIERFVYKKANKIITLLPGAYDYIKKFGVSKEKVVHIPNGVDINSFDNNLRNSTDLTIFESDSFNCVFAGAHGAANKLDNILDAAKITKDKGINNIKFFLVGEGPQKKSLIEYKEKLKLENVFFLDHIDKALIPRLLSKATIQIFNLKDVDVFKYGISSNKLFDYMCSGKPIVFACRCSNDIIEEARAGISVPPENPEALAEAVIKLYGMSVDELDALGKNGREYVEKYHSIPYLVDKLQKCFE